MSAELNWANWTYYMDVDPKRHDKFKTLEDFKAKYGTTVNYQEIIDDNDDLHRARSSRSSRPARTPAGT